MRHLVATANSISQKKEWWDDELTNLFKDMHRSEREYIKAKKNKTRFKRLFEIFKDKQKHI